MFVKQAYERRTQNQQDKKSNILSYTNHDKLPKIGSIKNDKINYELQQQYFSKQDIPIRIKEIKQEIKQLINPDNLGLRKRLWNNSVSIPKKFQEEQTQQQKLLKIKLGFLDHPNPSYNPPIIYQGTDSRNNYTKWNVSNEIENKYQKKQNLFKKTMSAFQNSKLKQTQYIQNYINPLQRTTNHINTFKQKQQKQIELRQELKNKYIFEHPTASMQKVNAATFRLAYQSIIKEKKDKIQSEGMKTNSQVNLSATQKQQIHSQKVHNGIWQKFKTIQAKKNDDDDNGGKDNNNQKQEEQEYYWAWSCCMNENEKHSGCIIKIKDKNKWNLSSFNNH